MTHQYVFVAVGIPASGKSAFYHRIADDNDWGMGEVPAYISSDMIRAELYGDESIQGSGDRVFQLVREYAESYLSAGHSVYIDATHLKKSWRKYTIELAQKYGAVCVAIYFHVPLWVLIKRDRTRKRKVGLKVLLRYFFGLEIPTKAEGFNAVFGIDRYGQYSEMDW